MRGTVAKRLSEEARQENHYPSAHEMVHIGTRNIELFPGKVVQLDSYQIRCVGRRMTYLEMKKAYKDRRPVVSVEKLQAILDRDAKSRDSADRRRQAKAKHRRRWNKVVAKITGGEDRRLTKDEVALARIEVQS